MNRSELTARLLVVATVAAVIIVPLLLWSRTSVVHARMPEAGGWSRDTLRAQVGVPLELHLTSDDVVHGFAVGKLDMPPVDIQPGKVTDVTINFQAPGTYTFYCTRWCGPNHWRMRGTIEVATDSGPAMAASAPETPLYAALGLDLDAPRASEAVPAGKPLAVIPQLQLQSALASYKSLDYYRSHAPADVWAQLGADPAFDQLDDEGLWRITAGLWRSNTDPASLAEGRRLFTENCAACHGTGAAGDGVFADDLAAEAAMSSNMGMIQSPADLADPSRMLAASPALLHGKIVRGGMGTGMPSWGPIFTEDEVWNLVAFIYSLQFEYP